MSRFARFWEGWTKAEKVYITDVIRFKTLDTPPTAETGTIYFDGENIVLCADGVNWRPMMGSPSASPSKSPSKSPSASPSMSPSLSPS